MTGPLPPPDQPCYPNKLGRIVLLALEETVGHTGLNAVLNLAGLDHLINNYPPNNLDLGFPFANLGAMHASLEELYGPRGGRGLALRAGRACFKHGLREFGPTLGIADLTYRLLPLNMKLKVGGEAAARILNRFSPQAIRFEESDDGHEWIIDRCGLCWGRESDAPCCHLAVGILQESWFWVSGGKNYLVEEVACIAHGDPACVLRVDRHPLD